MDGLELKTGWAGNGLELRMDRAEYGLNGQMDALRMNGLKKG